MKKSLTLLLTVVLILTGCSNSYDPAKEYTMTWNNGDIQYDGVSTGLSMYHGYEASIEGGIGGVDYYFTFEEGVVTPDAISINTRGVTTENMDKYKGMYYYAQNNGTLFVGLLEIAKETYMVCQAPVSGTQEVTATAAYDYMQKFKLSNAYYNVDFGDFTFGDGYSPIKMTPEYCSISGVGKVSLGSKGATEPYTVTSADGKKSWNLTHTSTDKYDYYEYNGYLIQIAKGFAVESYIQFK